MELAILRECVRFVDAELGESFKPALTNGSAGARLRLAARTNHADDSPPLRRTNRGVVRSGLDSFHAEP